MTGGETFWARRKANVAAEAEAEKAALEAQTLAEEHAALEEKTDAELLEEFGLPDPETLKMGDDFSVFMSKAIPDRLRRRALRTLWRSNPVLANVDMLVDYGEDFTDSATVVENMQTAYQVGKGMLKHVEEMARQAEEKARALAGEGESEDDTPDDGDEIEEEAHEDVLLADADPFDEADSIAFVDTQEEELAETYTPPTPRRMTFTVEGSTA